MKALGLFACVSLLLCACGPGLEEGKNPVSNPPDSNSPPIETQVQGTVNGRSFDAKGAMSAAVGHTNGFMFNGRTLFVEIDDFTDACSLAAQEKPAPTGSRLIDIGMAVNESSVSAIPTAPGTFTVYDSSAVFPANGNVAQVYYGSGCDKDDPHMGTSGTVTLTKVNADGTYEGTFDVFLTCFSCSSSDAHLTGSFHTADCSFLAMSINTTRKCN